MVFLECTGAQIAPAVIVFDINFTRAFHSFTASSSEHAHSLSAAPQPTPSLQQCTACPLACPPAWLRCAEPSGAMNQLTRNLACEWARDGIRVNTVAPWYTATDLANQVSSH